jgi:DNA-damage-inducible protein D
MPGQNIADHFPDVRKMVQMGSGAEKEIDDLLLTRYACYLIAQNGDTRKEQIASTSR